MKKLFKHRKYILGIKILVLVLLLGIFFWDYSHAEGCLTKSLDGAKVDSREGIVNFIIGILSWLWIVLANLAGKLMTNDRVYGSWMHMDVYLWKRWNLMKNFANFALGFIFLFFIIRGLFSQREENNIYAVIKKKIGMIFLAGILVNASRFLMGALLDISTLLTSAVGSIPAQIFVAESSFQANFMAANEHLLSNKYSVTVDPDKCGVARTKKPFTNGLETEEQGKIFDRLLPSTNDLSGPLLFMGMSIFEFQDFTSPWVGKDGKANRKDAIVTLGINLLILVMFTISLFFLVLFNLFRILALWIIIPILPLIIVLKALKLDELMSGVGGEGITAQTFIMLIFKPVLYTAYLSLMMIFLAGVYAVIKPGEGVTTTQDLDPSGNTTISQTASPASSTIESKGTLSVILKGKTTFAGLFVYIVAIALMRLLVKMSVTKGTTGIGFIDKSTDSLFETTENFMKSMPIVPVPGVGNLSQATIEKIPGQLQNPVAIRDGQTREVDKLLGVVGLKTSASNLKTLAEGGKPEFVFSYTSHIVDKIPDLNTWTELGLERKKLLSTWLNKTSILNLKKDGDMTWKKYFFTKKKTLNEQFTDIEFQYSGDNVQVRRKTTPPAQ